MRCFYISFHGILEYVWEMVGPGACSCHEEKLCRTGSISISVAFDACVQSGIDAGAAAIEHDGGLDCWIHMQKPSGTNNWHGTTCYSLLSGIDLVFLET